MKKSIFGFIGGVCAGASLVMLYLHRDVIKAAIKGEELPEAPEGCPAFKKDAAEEEPVAEEPSEETDA